MEKKVKYRHSLHVCTDKSRRDKNILNILSCYCNFASAFEYVMKRKDNSEKSETLIKCETTKEWLHFPTSPAENTHRRYTQMSTDYATSVRKDVCQCTEQKSG